MREKHGILIIVQSTEAVERRRLFVLSFFTTRIPPFGGMGLADQSHAFSVFVKSDTEER